jgi:hypothetical protein
MAAARLPKPGTEFGPCVDPCEHIDCAATRADADSLCHYCDGPIGYEERYYRDQSGALVHAICLEQAEQQEEMNE